MQTTAAKAHQKPLEALMESVVLEKGLRLYDFDLLPGQKLRVFIERPSPKGDYGSPTLEDCATVSRALRFRLGVDTKLGANYDLEVSSPGLERRLSKARHFRQVLGKKLKLRLKELKVLEGGIKIKNFEAQLLEVEPQKGLKLLKGNKEALWVEWSELSHAQLLFET